MKTVAVLALDHEFSVDDFAEAMAPTTSAEQGTAILRLLIGCYNAGWNDRDQYGPGQRPFIEELKEAINAASGTSLLAEAWDKGARGEFH